MTIWVGVFLTHPLTPTHTHTLTCRVLQSLAESNSHDIRSAADKQGAEKQGVDKQGADSTSPVTVLIQAPLKKRGHPRKWVPRKEG